MAGNKIITLYSHQERALKEMHNGCVLCGGVGSGKTLTSLIFYNKNYRTLKLYVITTAKKRDTHDWEYEAKLAGVKDITVDSWNNIKKYNHICGCYFIFDEQKISTYGTWSKSFIKIAHNNNWILLSATPGDTWMDYCSIFIANGYYRNKTDFCNQHVEYDRFAKYPKIKCYHNTSKLLYIRKSVLVYMTDVRKTKRIRKYIHCDYDTTVYTEVLSNRWDLYENEPISNPSRLTQVARRIVADSNDRYDKTKEIIDINDRIIVFYNYNYELEKLIDICKKLKKPFYQWNGRIHDPLPKGTKWAYIVQYNACEGWNCTTCDSMLFYSLNYSYKVTEQCEGRIDRMNTPYTNLYYYFMISNSSIDKSVIRALQSKKKFNEKDWGESVERK